MLQLLQTELLSEGIQTLTWMLNPVDSENQTKYFID